MTRFPKSITLPQSLWNEIDSLRGDIPRSKFLEKLILRGFSKND